MTKEEFIKKYFRDVINSDAYTYAVLAKATITGREIRKVNGNDLRGLAIQAIRKTVNNAQSMMEKTIQEIEAEQIE